jgi:hypothetical protein
MTGRPQRPGYDAPAGVTLQALTSFDEPPVVRPTSRGRCAAERATERSRPQVPYHVAHSHPVDPARHHRRLAAPPVGQTSTSVPHHCSRRRSAPPSDPVPGTSCRSYTASSAASPSSGRHLGDRQLDAVTCIAGPTRSTKSSMIREPRTGDPARVLTGSRRDNLATSADGEEPDEIVEQKQDECCLERHSHPPDSRRRSASVS